MIIIQGWPGFAVGGHTIAGEASTMVRSLSRYTSAPSWRHCLVPLSAAAALLAVASPSPDQVTVRERWARRQRLLSTRCICGKRWQSRRTCTRSSFPVRILKLQLTAEQLSTEECWLQPQKDTSHPGEKQKPQQDGRGNITFRIKLIAHQRCSEGSNKPCA